jgi:hypothetical protein
VPRARRVSPGRPARAARASATRRRVRQDAVKATCVLRAPHRTTRSAEPVARHAVRAAVSRRRARRVRARAPAAARATARVRRDAVPAGPARRALLRPRADRRAVCV